MHFFGICKNASEASPHKEFRGVNILRENNFKKMKKSVDKWGSICYNNTRPEDKK